jgi:hypothetical protein
MKNPQRPVPHWMRAASLAAAVAILPIGFAQAQEHDRGTHEQPEARHQEPGPGISVEEYRRAEVEIRKAVEAGEVSREDAGKRLIEMRKAIRSEESEGRGRGSSVEEYRRAEVEIRKAVEAGEVSREDAGKRLIEMRKAIRSE